MLPEIQNLWDGHPWKDRIHWFDTIDSTNTRAKEMAINGAPHGTTLIAGYQTAGRGRMGRSFQSPKDMGVYMSIILRPECSPQELMHLTCATAVAACNAVEAGIGMRPQIKWTNDLVWGKRKIAGILTELVTVGSQVCAIIGIGINCCQQIQDFHPDIQGFAGSLAMICQKPVDRAVIAAELVKAVLQMDEILLTSKKEIMESYTASCITVGQEVSILRGEEVSHGYAMAVDEDGALLVRMDNGEEKLVQSGEVSVRGMYGYI